VAPLQAEVREQLISLDSAMVAPIGLKNHTWFAAPRSVHGQASRGWHQEIFFWLFMNASIVIFSFIAIVINMFRLKPDMMKPNEAFCGCCNRFLTKRRVEMKTVWVPP